MNRGYDYIDEGRRYLQTAKNGRERTSVFNNQVTYNLIGLSVEKLLVGLSMHLGHLPADHTLAGIVAEVNRFCPMENDLAEAVRRIDQVQDMCSLDISAFRAISDGQIDHMLKINESVRAFVECHLDPTPAFYGRKEREL
ncbi:MAG: hypothetical protein HKP58_18405 [Desulfatitalea sp.]|nr:hypothetical protein [Desulfatitalea sp.]NNK02389.1 hypothetical protein [Desulfatitalea sp.]